jgi:NADP oxidoreductase coenzyme F420-dependent
MSDLDERTAINVIGLGSMGKRRIRCLQALGYSKICGMDLRADRREEAEKLYGIKTVQTTNGLYFADAVFISTPPKTHNEYATQFKDVSTFVEAGTEKLDYGTPSATMLFNPLVKVIQEKLPTIGKLVNITYHCGQYLPDWHPYEKVSDYYAAESACEEIMAFELMWMTKVFGELNYSKIRSRPYEYSHIEGLISSDVKLLVGTIGDAALSIMIDVVSRNPLRQIVINGTEKQLKYDLNHGISEQMYIDETKAFMDGEYPNTLEHSNRVIEVTKQL